VTRLILKAVKWLTLLGFAAQIVAKILEVW
jgi:hypothetical protein